MKKMLCTLVMAVATTIATGQQFIKNTGPQNQKEDPQNLFHADKLSSLDIAKALQLLGIHLYQFDLGHFDSSYNMIITIEEVTGGRLLKVDTLFNDLNSYTWYQRGEKDYYQDYLDQLKVCTRQESGKFTLQLQTYGLTLTKSISYPLTKKDQFYNTRSYAYVSWRSGKKIPLLVFASSWPDKKFGFQRFCGATELNENDKETRELLESSPQYYLVSYKILPLK